MSQTHCRSGFTLIELLVVISIIAVLMSLLLPTLKRAKRQAKVMHCTTNLKSYALGLTVYATEDRQGIYPPHTLSGWAGNMTLWSSNTPSNTYTSVWPDMSKYLAMFTDVICGGNRRILWCPLHIHSYWNTGVPNAELLPGYPDLWYDSRFGVNVMSGYRRYANLAHANFSNSGNSTNGPAISPGSAQDVIIADPDTSEPTLYQSVHLDFDNAVDKFEALAKRRETDVAYSDGHVEIHGQRPFIGADGFLTWDGAHYIPRGVERNIY